MTVSRTPLRITMMFVGQFHTTMMPVIEYNDRRGELESVPQPHLQSRNLDQVLQNCRRLARQHHVPFDHQELKETS